MGTENFVIDTYQYEIHNDIVHGAMRESTLLYLFDMRKNLLGAIAFMPDDAELARPQETAEGHVAIQMRHKSFRKIIDMLRKERPVYFSWWREAQSIRLSTKKEPVGEQELRKLFSFLYT